MIETRLAKELITMEMKSTDAHHTVVPPNSRLIGSKKNGNWEIRELGDLITVVNRSSQKLLLSKKKDI